MLFHSHVLSWYMAKAETTRAWRALLSRIAPPEVVVTDGGSGFASAVAAEWPETRVQRCLFHAFCQVKRHTTSRPRLQAGIELYGLARELMRLDDLRQVLTSMYFCPIAPIIFAPSRQLTMSSRTNANCPILAILLSSSFPSARP